MTGAPDVKTILGRIAEFATEAHEQTVPLDVPWWGTEQMPGSPTIRVHYRPVGMARLNDLRRKVEAAEKRPAAMQGELVVNLNADLLIEACDRVVAVIDGQEFSLRPGDPEGDPTRYDDELAAAIGFPEADIAANRVTARQVVRRLFPTDGHLINAVNALGEWSGYTEQQAAESVSGE